MADITSQISSTTVTWKEDASAGPIPAFIYYSKSRDESTRPVAIIFHIGGFVLGSTDLIPKNQINYLVNKGFVVVAPEYRLCPQVSLYDGPVQDAKDVLQWCQEKLPDVLKERGVNIDPRRIGAMGLSAGGMLALTTGLCPNPPLAIVDMYGVKQLGNPSWRRPPPMFTNFPDQPDDFISKIFEGPQVITSLPMFVDGKPNFSDPRCAWYIQQLKNGTSISSLVPDGDYARADPTVQLTKDFPATYFLHGKEDVFVNYELTVRTHAKLKELGVKTELDLVEGVGHVFDVDLKEGDGLFEKYVVPALEWLVTHV